MQPGLVIAVYLSSLPVAHLSDAPRRRLVVTGDSARIQDETTVNSAWFFNVLGVWHRHMGPRFNVSSERQLIFLIGQPGIRTHTCNDPKHYVHESYALQTELIGRLCSRVQVFCYIYTVRLIGIWIGSSVVEERSVFLRPSVRITVEHDIRVC